MQQIIIEKLVKDYDTPRKNHIKNLIKRSLVAKYNSVNLFVIIVDKKQSQSYNLAHRNKNYPTNVISLEDKLAVKKYNMLYGTIILCFDVIKEEALSQGKLLEEHFAHMIIHSTLHLQGYDHVLNKDATKMEKREVKILKELGISNPYAKNHI